MVARENRRWRRGTWGQVGRRPSRRALPSEGCGACPSSPRKTSLVSSSSVHSGDVGPGAPRWKRRRRGSSGSRVWAQDVRNAEGCPRCSGLGSGVHGLVRLWRSRSLLSSAPQLPGPRGAAPRVGPQPRTRPRAGPEPPVCPSSCAPTLQPWPAVGLDLVDIPALIFL